MKTFLKIGLLLAFFGASNNVTCLFAQLPAAVPVTACKAIHKTLTPKNPRLEPDGSILSGQTIVQMKLALDQNTILKVIEHPRSEKDVDIYNSTLVVQRSQLIKSFALGELIRGGEVLRLVETATICTSSDQGIIFLAFESAATGAAEGFAVVRYSPHTIDVQGLPMANQGRIVIAAAKPDRVELWSATGSVGIECDACKKRYIVEDCQFGQQKPVCTKRTATVGPFLPDKFMRARIDIR